MILAKSSYAPLGDAVELDSLSPVHLREKDSDDYSTQLGTGMHHTQASQNTFSEEPKTIQIKNILSITTPEAMKIQWWDYMNWGRGFNRIWWARDDKRGTREKHDVIIFSENGETLLKACSVEYRQRALDVLKERMMLS